MSEMAVTASHLIVIGRGKLIADMSVDDFIARAAHNVVRVRTTDPDGLRAVLSGPDVTVATASDGGALEVSGLTSDQIGIAAAARGITLLELSPQQASLEEAFMDLTHDDVEFHTGSAAPATPVVPGATR
jgi:ABC-2 type transport system ATP-binding protein